MDLTAAAGLLAFAACSADVEAGEEEPLDLSFAAFSEPRSYVAEYQQDIEWGTSEVQRRYGARYTFTRVGEGAGGLSATAVLDSLGVGVSSPHGRQVFDTRYLAGSEFALTISERGGAPAYDAEPVFDMTGMLEGTVTLSRLMNYGFPELPDHPVTVGDSWTSRSARSQVEAYLTMPASIETEYSFTGWETIDGVDCARIEARIVGKMTAQAVLQHGQRADYTGTLEGHATWHFDPDAGSLLQMSGEESSDGLLSTGQKETPIKQHTRVEIRRRETS
jgi:hypothetical protein